MKSDIINDDDDDDDNDSDNDVGLCDNCVYTAQRAASYFNVVSHGVNYSQASYYCCLTTRKAVSVVSVCSSVCLSVTR